ncbi:MAG: hypothetical protein IJ657_00075 [Acidaminococcaceae bacterium]|nr:hypothetical protein [Acidaminococcaceae bacterium]
MNEDLITISTEEYKHLVRCEATLQSIFILAEKLSAYEFLQDVQHISEMFPELIPPKQAEPEPEKGEDA